MPDIVEQAKENTRKSGGSFGVKMDDLMLVKKADVIYAKSWGCWMATEDKEESAVDWQEVHQLIDSKRMKLANKMPFTCTACLLTATSKRTDEVIEGPQSVVYDEAENRLHVQKAAMALTMR
ncbi:MAG: hypothetical protein R3E39_02225 [Anaerolineae bacterium]